MARTYDPQTDCRLLQLTAELRNLIYEYVFTVPLNSIILPSAPTKERRMGIVHDVSSRGLPPHSVMSLSRTCRQIYDEASGVFYHINHIYIYSHRLSAFSITANLRSLRSIRALTVVVGHGEDITATLKTLRRATALRVLKFDLRPYDVDLRPYDERFANSSFQSIAKEHHFIKRALASLAQVEQIGLSPYDPKDWVPEQIVAMGKHEAFLKQGLVKRSGRK